MTKYYLTATGAEKKISLAPKTQREEIEQNLMMILTTYAGSVPLYRDFGIDSSVLDQPQEIAHALISSSIYEMVDTYEPRASIEEIHFMETEEQAANGQIIPKLTYTIQEVNVDGVG